MASVKPTTTIYQQGLGTQTTPKTVSGVASSYRRVQVTTEAAKDPVQMSRLMTDIVSTVDDVTHALRSFPFMGGVWLVGITTTGAGAITLNHRLGRVPNGWFATRFKGAFAQVYEVFPQPAAVQTDSQIQLNVSAATTFDLYVF